MDLRDLHAAPSEVAALVAAVVPEEARATLTPDDLAVDAPTSGPAAALLEYHFVERLVDDWLELFAEPASRPRRVRDESWMNRDAFLEEEMLADGRIVRVRAPGPRWHPDRRRPRPPRPASRSAGRGRAPLLGEHTREVLAELGYDDEGIDALRRGSRRSRQRSAGRS